MTTVEGLTLHLPHDKELPGILAVGDEELTSIEGGVMLNPALLVFAGMGAFGLGVAIGVGFYVILN